MCRLSRGKNEYRPGNSACTIASNRRMQSAKTSSRLPTALFSGGWSGFCGTVSAPDSERLETATTVPSNPQVPSNVRSVYAAINRALQRGRHMLGTCLALPWCMPVVGAHREGTACALLEPRYQIRNSTVLSLMLAACSESGDCLAEPRTSCTANQVKGFT